MRLKNGKTRVGIGFVTGRKNFKSVARSYLENWKMDSAEKDRYILNLFVAYDLTYKSTLASDYKIVDENLLGMVDTINYLGTSAIDIEADNLIKKKIITKHEETLLFKGGYAGKRNAVLYLAIKNKMDSLIFLDDDEYPMACAEIDHQIFWKGQDIIRTHLSNLNNCDMTHGHHCGYISPIPNIKFDDNLSENTFRLLIESISNDILSWDSVYEKMKNGGITFANKNILKEGYPYSIKELHGMKFISGANLGINLKNPEKTFPFYNPPDARGEDTFLSTCISEMSILKVPCYTFHDGFSNYHALLTGALPQQFAKVTINTPGVINRFLKACIGWVRYKPLYLYITNKEIYSSEIQKIRENLIQIAPSLCGYFKTKEFNSLITNLDKYHNNVEKHFDEFEQAKFAWQKIMSYLSNL